MLPSDRLGDLETELEKLESRLPEIYASGDQRAARDAGRRHAELKPVVDAWREYRQTEHDLREAKEMLAAEGNAEMREFLRGEAAEKETSLTDLETRLRELLLPRDPNDGKNVIVEVRGAVGGEEANLWAGDLFRMYQRYAAERGWRVEIDSLSEGDAGGYKEIIASVTGDGVFGRLKFESGVHRVQRVPATEAQGRIHTSAATVAVLPEPEDVEIDIKDGDIRIDTYRSSGAGGQHVNKTDSAVRITHLPTGIVVTSSEKSQHQNRARAMKALKVKLYDQQREALDTARSDARKSQVGSGDRSERIRTYNFPQGRITDHRINLTLYNLPKVLEGEALDEVIEPLIAEDQAARLATLEDDFS
jgi:peptide chain release factor 1